MQRPMTLEEWKLEQEDDDFMFRLGSLSQHRTGLTTVVWIGVRNGAEHEVPRMLFSNTTDCSLRPGDNADSLIPISLDPESPKVLLEDVVLRISPFELEAIKRWIVRNYRPLMKHWNGEIDSVEAVAELIASLFGDGNG